MIIYNLLPLLISLTFYMKQRKTLFNMFHVQFKIHEGLQTVLCNTLPLSCYQYILQLSFPKSQATLMEVARGLRDQTHDVFADSRRAQSTSKPLEKP